MSLLLMAIVIYLSVRSRTRVFWLVLPLGLIIDFWRINPLGYSGMAIVALLAVIWWFFPPAKKHDYKIV